MKRYREQSADAIGRTDRRNPSRSNAEQKSAMRNDFPKAGATAAPSWPTAAFGCCANRDPRHRRRTFASRSGAERAGLARMGSRLSCPSIFASPPSRMHLWLAEQFDAMRIGRGRKLNVVGPRGGAKSTIGTLAFVLRAAVEGREPYIWIVSDTKHQAVSHLENLKTELRDNPRLAAAYPQATGRAGVARKRDALAPTASTIEAFGTGQRIRGRRRRADRPTLIVCDDLQDDRHIESSLARDHSRRWFHGMLMKAGTKRTNVVNLATALHREALAHGTARDAGLDLAHISSHRALARPDGACGTNGSGSTPTSTARMRGRRPARFYERPSRGDGSGRRAAVARGRRPLHADVHAAGRGPHGLRARKARRADQSGAVRMARGVFRRLALVRRLADEAGESDWPWIRARGKTPAAAIIRPS